MKTTLTNDLDQTRDKSVVYFSMMTENIRFLGIKENGHVLVSTCVQNPSLDDGPDITVKNVVEIHVTADLVHFAINEEG